MGNVVRHAVPFLASGCFELICGLACEAWHVFREVASSSADAMVEASSNLKNLAAGNETEANVPKALVTLGVLYVPLMAANRLPR